MDEGYEQDGEPWDYMDDDQAAQMESGVDAVTELLGRQSTISTRDIKSALWESYFDVDEAVDWLLQEQSRKDAAQKKAQALPVDTQMAELSLDPTPTQLAPTRAPPPIAAPAPAERAKPVKPLSKLQLKMQAAAAAKAKKAGAPAAPPPVVAPPEPMPQPPEPVAPAAPLPSLVAQPSLFASAMSSLGSRQIARASAAQALEARLLVSSAALGRANAAFEGPSPDDVVFEKRKGTALGVEKAKAKAAAAAAPPPQSKPKAVLVNASSSKPVAKAVSQLRQDMEGLNLLPTSSQLSTKSGPSTPGSSDPVGEEDSEKWDEGVPPPAPAMSVAREKILEQVKEQEQGRPALSLVVVGHVDAGKSTLMGRVLHELGMTTQRALENNERQAQKAGKGSFALAWSMDALEEERERGVTIDIAVDSFLTEHRRFTLLDAPGHKDFIPNMISGAAQADAAILVVDGAPGAFEKGFEGGGQTREHARLVRSLGVRQVVVAVNKLDAVEWAQSRFESIRELLTPFLAQSGFHPSMVSFIPVGAISGENIVGRSEPKLECWYKGRTLVEELDQLQVPPRSLDAPLRLPLANVFRGQTATASGLAVAGRIESGLVQVGERLAALPGDESGVVRALEVDGESVPWAVAGANVTVFLSGIDPNQLSVGSVLCPPTALVPVVSTFTAQVMLFDLKVPITAGAAVELFHHSRDVPATITGLEAVLDKASGEVLKERPRMLTRNSSARIQVQLRPPIGGGGTKKSVLPLETFASNKGMGRVLFRRNGETIAAGIVLSLLQ